MNQENEVESKIDRAYLTDRVAITKNMPQIYGTQLFLNKETNKWETYKLLDPENVDKRRTEIGLGPLEF